MKKKKMLVGVIVSALVLTAATAVYAAEPQISNWFAPEIKGDISSIEGGKDVFSFDETNLPDGIEFRDEISMSGGEAISFDETDLPDSVEFKDEISMGGEDSLSFDETDLPDGVEFKDEISMDNGESSMIFE